MIEFIPFQLGNFNVGEAEVEAAATVVLSGLPCFAMDGTSPHMTGKR